MGAKRKLTKIAVVVLLYFFLSVYIQPDSSSHPGCVTGPDESGSGPGRTARRGHVFRITDAVEDGQESSPGITAYLLSSDYMRYLENTSVLKPERTRFTIVIEPTVLNTSIYVAIDGSNVSEERFSPDLGVHHVELIVGNETIAYRDITIVTQEAYQAQSIANVEPGGLRFKAAFVAALIASLFVPLGMWIRRRRSKEVIL